MIGVTPLGILTDKPGPSRQFYKQILGIERVQTCSEMTSPEARGTLMRLESPQVEVFATETRLLDRTENTVISAEHRLIMRPRDPQALVERLAVAGINISRTSGGSASFEDMNGINWEIRGLM
ncbi:MAG TPA: VOC family protein [Candidatus Ozemobacteraceae bacterium]|nr:VOC family protein [Candidatus Ozemobacteraceae bacterium]